MGIGAAAAGAQSSGLGPRRAECATLVAQPGVPQQRSGSRPALRIFLEARAQEVLHVCADAVWQHWVLILPIHPFHIFTSQAIEPKPALFIFEE